MNKPHDKIRLSINTIFLLAALVIIVDFMLPGHIFNDKIISVQKEEQQYYNAAGNSHFSNQIVTSEHQFSVTEEFAEIVQDNDKIEYSVSEVFKKVNWYRLPSSDNRFTYSLRTISGLVLPLLMILSIFVAYRFKKNIGILVFVLQALLIADLVFLLL